MMKKCRGASDEGKSKVPRDECRGGKIKKGDQSPVVSNQKSNKTKWSVMQVLSLDTRYSTLFSDYYLFLGGLNICLLGQADQISDRVDAKLLHDATAVDFDGFFCDVQL